MGDHLTLERYFWFDREVRTGKYPNAAGLARRFEVSRKTGQRDIGRMQERFEAPLAYDKGRKGYYYTDESFSLVHHQINQEELLAILLARSLLSFSAGGVISETIHRFGRKLFSATRRFGLSEARIETSFSAAWHGYEPAQSATFRITVEALLNDRVLTFTYRSPLAAEPGRRRVEPHHLQHYMGSWVLLAWCRHRQAWRKFYLSRMEHPVAEAERFEPRPGQEWQGQLEGAFGIFQGQKPVQVVLHFNARRAPWIREQIWHSQQTMRDLPDGGLELIVPVADLREIKMNILRFGADVEVIEPRELREQIRREIARMKKIYSR